MATPKIIRTESFLPESIIQHIQSFLMRKQAARTSVISNSWYKAWLTRPNIDFSQQDFEDAEAFWNAVMKAVHRHQELSLKIESFKVYGVTPLDSGSILAELLGKVLKMGIRDINIDIYRLANDNGFVLPSEVLETESLDRLSLCCGMWGRSRIDLMPSGRVICSVLKSLYLQGIILEDDLFSHKFPHLEDLTIVNCDLLKSLNCPRVKSLTLDYVDTEEGFSCFLPCLENLALSEVYVLESINCSRVKSLRLSHMRMRDNVSYVGFPCLVELILDRCKLSKVLEISSHTLKYLSLLELKKLRAKFDVPSIRKFKLSGSYAPSKLPSLSFTVASWEWESDISLHIGTGRGSKCLWCLHLRRFMRNFSKSKVSLRIINFGFEVCVFDEKLKDKCDPQPVVDNLTLLDLYPCCASSKLLNCLLRSCRPKLITLFWFPESSRSSDKESNEFIKVMCKELIQVREESCSQSQILHVNQDVKDVNVEYFDRSLAEWQPLAWKTLLSASESPQVTQKLRFRLEWHGREVVE